MNIINPTFVEGSYFRITLLEDIYIYIYIVKLHAGDT
jgi:hypothetical protein